MYVAFGISFWNWWSCQAFPSITLPEHSERMLRGKYIAFTALFRLQISLFMTSITVLPAQMQALMSWLSEKVGCSNIRLVLEQKHAAKQSLVTHHLAILPSIDNLICLFCYLLVGCLDCTYMVSNKISSLDLSIGYLR